MFDYIARAGNCPLFTDAIPLLPGAGPFACCVATLGRYVPHYRTWAHQNSFSVTMLTSGLVRTPDLHRQTATSGPELKPSNHSNLQAAGLQVHATTPGKGERNSTGINHNTSRSNNIVPIEFVGRNTAKRRKTTANESQLPQQQQRQQQQQ